MREAISQCHGLVDLSHGGLGFAEHHERARIEHAGTDAAIVAAVLQARGVDGVGVIHPDAIAGVRRAAREIAERIERAPVGMMRLQER